MQAEERGKELEFRFLIPRKKLLVVPPKRIGVFELVSSNKIKLEDVLFERKRRTLKSDGIGIRIRKQNGKNEFTYKKFISRVGGVAKFDEITREINNKFFSLLEENKFQEVDDSFIRETLDRLQKKGTLFSYLEVINRRSVFNYSNHNLWLEMVIEDLTYKAGGKKATDAMIEIELKQKYSSKINDFLEKIKSLYDAREIDQGKNVRAAKLLGLT